MLGLPLIKKKRGPENGVDCSHVDAIKTMETAGETSDFCRHRLSKIELMTYRQAHPCYGDKRTGVSHRVGTDT